MRKTIYLIIGMSMFVPTLVSAKMRSQIVQLQPTAEVVDGVLGPALPESKVRVPFVSGARVNSVHFTDNKTNLTNRVLDRSLRRDAVRVKANLHNPVMFADIEAWTFAELNNARIQYSSGEENCKFRLQADKIPNSTVECGPGFARRR